jgi:beta-aspartyl-dipeptidase (metallo-type)
MGLPDSNLRELRDAVLEEGIGLETALPVLTSNVAQILKLRGKGIIDEGADADILFLDSGLKLVHLLAMGNWVARDGKVMQKDPYI